MINKHKEYLSYCDGIKLNSKMKWSKMETLSLVYWISNMHKYPAG